MKTILSRAVLSSVIFLFLLFTAYARAEGPPRMPPAKVVVAAVQKGVIAPESTFTGTVYYSEVSDVASELRGLVKEVAFEEGRRVSAAEVLVRLDTELLAHRLESTRAAHEEVLVELKKARRDLERTEPLHSEGFVSDQDYDAVRFRTISLEKKAGSLEAQVKELEAELRKTTIKAPFGGLILKRHVDRGEWIESGGVVATLARDSVVDIIVDVPQKVIPFISEGMTVEFTVGARPMKGRLFAIVPKGDVRTRTFPVKIRAKNRASLKEGMEAVVTLPVAAARESLVVPRDALIEANGTTVVYTVVQGRAKMVPVKVVGFRDGFAGIETPVLKAGMKVVVKGNERLREGQPVMVSGGGR